MSFQLFAELSDMLIDGMEKSVKISHDSIDKHDFAVCVGEMVLGELEKGDDSPEHIWTDQQAPGLRFALSENKDRSPEEILKLCAPGLVALSAESGDNLKNLAYHVTYSAFQTMLGRGNAV